MIACIIMKLMKNYFIAVVFILTDQNIFQWFL